MDQTHRNIQCNTYGTRLCTLLVLCCELVIDNARDEYKGWGSWNVKMTHLYALMAWYLGMREHIFKGSYVYNEY